MEAATPMTTRDPYSQIWSDAWQLLEQAERLHRQFFQFSSGGGRSAEWEAPVDMIESADTLRVLVALPGVAPEKIRISFEGGALTVVGERPMPGGSRKSVIRRLEIPYGRFQRRIELPADWELASHDYRDGCLELVLRKAK